MSLTLPKIKDKKIPFIRIQLKEEKQLLKEMNYPVLDFEKRILYKDGTSRTNPFPFSHTMVAFPLPEDYKKRNLRIVVLGPKGDIIYKAPIPKKWKKAIEKSPKVALIDKID